MDSVSVTSFGFSLVGLYVAVGSTLIGSSGFPNASHSFPTCDWGNSCFGLLVVGLVPWAGDASDGARFGSGVSPAIMAGSGPKFRNQ
jgi:hypothetical protein